MDSLESSSVPKFENINPLALSLIYGPTLTSLHDYWKHHALSYRVQKQSQNRVDGVEGDVNLERNAMANLDSVLKSRDITLPTKAHIVKAMVFPVVMYTCESWTIKEA